MLRASRSVAFKGLTEPKHLLLSLLCSKGMTLLMMGSADALPEEPVARPVFVEDMTEEQLASAVSMLPASLPLWISE